MIYKNLGHSPLKVSRICLGTMMFADQTSLAEARSIVDHAQQNGCNFIDTADVYSFGKSEVMTGELIKAKRNQWILASKVGNSMSDNVNEREYSRTWMLRACEDSLSRLQTDHLDIYYLHRDFNGMHLEEPLRAIESLLRDGKIRYWGLSNFRGWRIAEVMRLCQQMNMPAPVVCQPYYNLLNRLPEVEILEACAHYGIGVASYSPIARGILTGKYAPGAAPIPESRLARGDKRILETEYRKESLEIAQKLSARCEEKGIQLSHFALAWVLANRAVTSVIGGPRTLAQWQDYWGALEVTITQEDEDFVNQLVSPGHPSTPGYNDPSYPLSARRA